MSRFCNSCSSEPGQVAYIGERGSSLQTSQNETFLLLRETTTDEDLYRFVGDLGYRLVRQGLPEEGVAFQMLYASSDGESSVDFIIEPVVHLPVLILRGAGQPELERLAEKYFDVVSGKEVRQMYAPQLKSQEKRKALAYVALASLHAYDDWVQEVLEEAARDDDKEVRMDALFVLRYAAKPELLSIAEGLSAGDEDSDVRAAAIQMTETLKKFFSSKKSHGEKA